MIINISLYHINLKFHILNKQKFIFFRDIGLFMSDTESFKLRLELALAKSQLSKAELARAIGETPQLINRWLNSEYANLPASNYVSKVADALDVNLLWLVTGQGSMTSNIITCNEQSSPNGFIPIPEYNVNFGAGDCEEPTYDEIQDSVTATYRKEFFDKRGINPKHCKRFHVKGNSMEPLINDGDCILVDCEPTNSIDNGSVYALVYDHSLKVKRLIKEFNQLIIKSDNKDYPDIILTANDLEQIYIIGKVIERSGAI